MTTVVSPGSSPVPVYNKSGVTVDNVTAAATPTVVTKYAGTSVYIVDQGGDPGNGVRMFSDGEVGDAAEFYSDNSGGPFVLYMASGETLWPGVSSRNVANFALVRKTSSTGWSIMSLG